MTTKMARVIYFCPPMTLAMGTTSAFIECQQEPLETSVKLCQRDYCGRQAAIGTGAT